MLNKVGKRELAYLVRVENITPMNADRLECAHIGGWHCVVEKNSLKVGDIAIYFEVDSKLPDVPPFSEIDFLRSKDFKIKTQKIRGEYSQGLLVPIDNFGWKCVTTYDDDLKVDKEIIVDDKLQKHYIDDESKFLTEQLGVTYYIASDNIRKSTTDKYKSMASRHPNVFKKKWARWLMKRTWGRKLMFFFFGNKKDKKKDWPSWVVKTDEERIQNCTWLLADTNKQWIATEKIDGSSTTFTIKGFGRKREFYVCSRNVVFDKPDKKCFYDTNIYTEMAEKYDMATKMWLMLNSKKYEENVKDIEFITIQAETYGAGVQRRDYGIEGHDMAIFNIIFGYKDGHTMRLNPIEGEKFAKTWRLPYVPVLGIVSLPNDCDEVIKKAGANVSKLDGGMREGIVFRSLDGVQSFKAVSNEYLLKYHG